MKKIKSVLFAGLLLPGLGLAQSCEDGLNACIKIFKDGYPTQKTVMVQQLEWLGYSDSKLFDLIEKTILDSYEQAKESNQIEHLSWMIKGLGFSGNEKYRATIDKVIASKAHRKLRKYAKQALELLDKYKNWNPVISDKSKSKSGKSALINGYANMLRSNDLELNRLGAKRIYSAGQYDPYLLDLMAEAAKRSANKEKLEGADSDSISWLLKVLASTIDAKYTNVVQEISENSSNNKIKRLASGYLKDYAW